MLLGRANMVSRPDSSFLFLLYPLSHNEIPLDRFGPGYIFS